MSVNCQERTPLSIVARSHRTGVSGVWTVTRKKKMAQKTGLQLFVSRLSSYTTNHEFKRLFSPFGVVTEARLVVEPKTHRPKGFGFVTFESEADAGKALKAMNGRIVNGRLIFVEVAKDTQ